LFVLGGKCDVNFLSAITELKFSGNQVLDLLVVSSSPTTHLPEALAMFTSVLIAHFIFVIGGEADAISNSIRSTVHRLDMRTNEWVRMANLPVSLCGHVSSMCKESILVVGGIGGGIIDTDTTLDSVFSYNIIDNVWEAKNPFPKAICLAAACSGDGITYVSGGLSKRYGCRRYVQCDSDDVQDDICMYDHDGDAWLTIGKLCKHAYGRGMVYHRHGKLYITGGRGGPGMDNLQCFNIESKQCTMLTAMPVAGARSQFGCALLNDEIYVLGGEEHTHMTDAILVYSIADDTWKEDTQCRLPCPVYGCVAVCNDLSNV